MPENAATVNATQQPPTCSQSPLWRLAESLLFVVPLAIVVWLARLVGAVAAGGTLKASYAWVPGASM